MPHRPLPFPLSKLPLLFAVICPLLSAPRTRAAETLGVVPDSATALSMAGGRYANEKDLAAIHSSPANIADLTEIEAELNLSVWYGGAKFTQAGTGDSVKTKDPWKILGSFYSAFPIIPGKLVFGLGVTTPFGLDSQMPKKGPVKYLVPYEEQLITVNINPVLAFKPIKSVSIGLGMDIMYSSLEFKQLYPWSQVVPGLALPDGVSHIEGDGWGVGAFGSILWKITPRQRVTVIGRLPVQVEYEGRFHLTEMPEFIEATGVSPRTDFKSNVRFPGSISAGYGLDVTDKLTLGADFLWAMNSSHDDIPLDIGKDQSLLGRDGLIVNWKNAITMGVGGQYQLDEHWAVRAGFQYSETSMSDQHYTPAVPSNDRYLMSAGFGYRSRHHSLDLAYSYAYFPERTVVGADEPAFDGKYKIGWHIMTASYSYRF
jgi:long-chain fatty acid transport protein